MPLFQFLHFVIFGKVFGTKLFHNTFFFSKSSISGFSCFKYHIHLKKNFKKHKIVMSASGGGVVKALGDASAKNASFFLRASILTSKTVSRN